MCEWKCNIKMDLQESVWVTYWIDLAYNSKRWLTLLDV